MTTPRKANGADAAPHSTSSEQATVGGLLLESAERWSAVAAILTADDFYDTRHRMIYRAIETLARANLPADPVTVSDELTRSGELEECGGFAYLSQLARETPTAANIGSYANAVREKALLRQVQKLGTDLAALVGDEDLDVVRRPIETMSGRLQAHGQPPPHLPLDWGELANQVPPEREWAIDHWLGLGHVTLMAGGGGTGKSLLAQAMGTCIALRREYLGWIADERRVLMWACEDDAAELWRRQVAIAQWLQVPLHECATRFVLQSYDAEEVELAGVFNQHLISSPMMTQLREQIGDFKINVAFLDNIARVFAGNENDRHQVSSFVAMLMNAARPMNAGIVLLGHPGKARGSEYSGSTAWENAVRSRLYLGRKLPNQDAEDRESAVEPEDDGVRYLCRRKANYGPRDWRRLHYLNGVLVPEIAPEPTARLGGAAYEAHAREVVCRATRKLASMGEYGVSAKASPNYLPKLATRFKLLENLTEPQFATAMFKMRTDGRLVLADVGRYANRTRRQALVVRDE